MLSCACEMSVCELVSATADGSTGCSLISEKSVSDVVRHDWIIQISEKQET